MSGQIIDASIVAAPKQRNTDGENRDIKEDRIRPNGRATRPSRARKHRDGPVDRQIHQAQAERRSTGGAPRVDLAVSRVATRATSASTAGIA